MEFVFSITPGPAVLLISAYGFRRGFPAALAAVLGVETGNTIYLALSALGLGALLVASSIAFEIVKWTGAAYLVALGIWTIWKSGKESHS
jgi:threonine/homoserine/homoserine lactone efflux protein